MTNQLNSNNLEVYSISEESAMFIKKFQENFKKVLHDTLKPTRFKNITEFLEVRFGLVNTENTDPDFHDKTKFITTGTRGSVQKSSGKILSYKAADAYVQQAIDRPIP